MRKLWKLCLTGLCLAGLLVGCGKKQPPAIQVREEMLQYRGMRYTDFAETEGVAAEYISGAIRQEPVVEGRATAGFVPENWRSAGNVDFVAETASCDHLEGLLGSMVNGLEGELTPAELAEKLAWQGGTVLEAVEVADGDKAFHVGKKYVEVKLDTDGDGALDLLLEINMDHSDKIWRKSRSRLCWLDAAAEA